MSTFRILIAGKVQGVFYRATAKKVADELGVAGWVKNTPDDNVVAVVTGTGAQLEKFVAWCKQGPPRAKVTDVIVEEQEETEFDDFSVIR